MSERTRQEFWASLCLKHSPGLGPRTSKKILERFGSAAKAVDNAARWQGMGLATSAQLQSFLAQSWLSQAQDELAVAHDKGIDVLLWSDPRYPERLREIPDPPVFLYAIGDLGLLDFPGVAMVGSRDSSRYGIELARRIAVDLSAAGITVISGMAHGIDREAHLGGLSGPGSSIAVMGTGPDLIYPASNRDLWRELAGKGLVLSEFPPGTKPLAANFPKRNRIISGLSLGVLVVEASTRSGSLITARLAMEQGREVFALPGPVSLPSYRGCHEIINKGAKLIHGAEDILLEIKPQLEAFLARQGHPKISPSARPVSEQASLLPARSAARAPQARSGPDERASRRAKSQSSSAGGPGLDPAQLCAASHIVPGQQASSSLEETVAGHLEALGATHIDSLCRVLGKDASEMSRTLVVLELKGVVRRLPGGYYLSA
ncbi:MAG: DNA-protecting protein DprA [Desulfovibrio sp.]|nr:DNA-protecting protein DprA [Desulfovibrio sp.]MBI4960584.1 DNA-protecting protein DprA [Desulfovibrio sp.]